MATIQGKIVLGTMMMGMMKHMNKGGDAGSMAEMAKSDTAKEMMGGFTVLRIASMIGGFMNIEITKEQLKDILNDLVSKILFKSTLA